MPRETPAACVRVGPMAGHEPSLRQRNAGDDAAARRSRSDMRAIPGAGAECQPETHDVNSSGSRPTGLAVIEHHVTTASIVRRFAFPGIVAPRETAVSIGAGRVLRPHSDGFHDQPRSTPAGRSTRDQQALVLNGSRLAAPRTDARGTAGIRRRLTRGRDGCTLDHDSADATAVPLRQPAQSLVTTQRVGERCVLDQWSMHEQSPVRSWWWQPPKRRAILRPAPRHPSPIRLRNVGSSHDLIERPMKATARISFGGVANGFDRLVRQPHDRPATAS